MTVAETVREAQELLYLSHFSRASQGWLAWKDRLEVQYPQTLGELCLEVGNDWAWSSSKNHIWYVYTKHVRFEVRLKDIQDLRRLLYHKG